MLHRFSTFEEAALFSLAKRQEGYFAEILHLNSGLIYGSIASNGFPVLVSEYAVHDNEETPEINISYPALLHLVAKILFGLAIVIVSIPLILLCFSLVRTAMLFPINTVVVLFNLLWRVGAFILLFSLYIKTIIFIFKAYRDTSNAWNKPAKIIFKIVLVLVAPMIILLL